MAVDRRWYRRLEWQAHGAGIVKGLKLQRNFESGFDKAGVVTASGCHLDPFITNIPLPPAAVSPGQMLR